MRGVVALAWMGIMLMLAAAAAMWLALNAIGVLVYLAAFLIIAVILFLTLWAFITLVQRH